MVKWRLVAHVVLDELAHHGREVAPSGDQQVVEAFAAQRADEALGDRVRPRPRVPQLMLMLDTESGFDLRERRKPPGRACVQAVVFVLVRTLPVAARVR